MNPKSAKPRVIRNVASNWGAYILAMAVSFFLSPYVVHHLGNNGYGVWTLILSLTGYLGLLDLGVRGAVTRYVARFHSQAAHGNASNVASSAMLIFSSAGLIAFCTSVVLATLIVGRLKIPPQYLAASRVVLVVTGLSIATSLVNGVFGGVLVGLQRFDLTNGIEIANNLLRTFTIVLFLHLGYGIVTLALIQLGFTLARLAANFRLARHLYPELRINLAFADRAGVKLIFSFSIFSFLMHVGGSLIYASDNVVIGAFLPVSAVTFYAIGGNLAEYTRTLVAGISQTMTPLASSAEAKEDRALMEKIVLFGSRAGTMVVLPIALTLMIRGSSFIGLWMGTQYADLSGAVIRILSLTLLFWAANSVTGGTLLGLSKHKPIVPMILAEGVCNLALSIFLVRRMGIVGVAWGTVIPSMASTFLFWPWYIRRSLQIDPLRYAASAWLRPGIAILPFAIASFAIEHILPATTLIVFFLQVACLLPLVAIGYWLVCLDTEQRAEYSQRFVTLFGRAPAQE
ncbi:MAG TPA: flippase [Candidatus Acidoferrum sp.]|nr:flippase [Candidatus Acidoferrum sp.]